MQQRQKPCLSTTQKGVLRSVPGELGIVTPPQSQIVWLHTGQRGSNSIFRIGKSLKHSQMDITCRMKINPGSRGSSAFVQLLYSGEVSLDQRTLPTQPLNSDSLGNGNKSVDKSRRDQGTLHSTL